MFSSTSTTNRTRHLTTTPLFKPQRPGISSRQERERIYERAREIARAYSASFASLFSFSFFLFPSCLLSNFHAQLKPTDDHLPSLPLDFTSRDITSLTEKFWQMPADLVGVIDASAMILLTIQYNLAAGTLASFAERRPDLQPLMKRILKFDISCVTLLFDLRILC